MADNASTTRSLIRIAPYSSSDRLRVIIETPKGSRNKYDYDEELDLFQLGGVLTAGAVFPFDFGFIPRTLGGDGDPLDVLVLMDQSAFTGCLVEVRLVGVIEANQTERDGKTTRNDRLIAIASESHAFRGVDSLDEIGQNVVRELEYFFVSYNEAKDKKFEPVGRYGRERARAIVEQGIERFHRRETGER